MQSSESEGARADQRGQVTEESDTNDTKRKSMLPRGALAVALAALCFHAGMATEKWKAGSGMHYEFVANGLTRAVLTHREFFGGPINCATASRKERAIAHDLAHRSVASAKRSLTSLAASGQWVRPIYWRARADVLETERRINTLYGDAYLRGELPFDGPTGCSRRERGQIPTGQ